MDVSKLLEEHRLIITPEGLACTCKHWWKPGPEAQNMGIHDFQHHLLEIALPVRFEVRRPPVPEDPGVSSRWG